MKTIFQGVYAIDNYIYTENLTPGRQVYKERLLKKDNTEYRNWDPFRSKLCAAIRKGLRTFPFSNSSKILYLGASTGTTISHLSDIATEGEVYSVEISQHVIKPLLALSEIRHNIIPILADARNPADYKEVGEVDALYQDVASPEQAEILIKNSKMFLKKGGIAMVAIKSQSIDVTKEPKEVFEEFLRQMSANFEILEKYELEPFDKDHLFVVLKKLE
jgi:fibrillarin-like pre-rRNA processing protein